MRIAVIGAGITGMGAAWLLDQAGNDVVLWEKEGRLGGHSNTVDAPHPNGGTVPVDTGFIVFNDLTYPNLIRLFERLEVPVEPSNMSFAVSADGGRLEYSGNSIGGLFAQRRNLLKPAHWGMIRDILRFYREAPSVLGGASDGHGGTLADFLAENRYGHAFVYDHLLPMGAAIWSATLQEMMRFPASSFVRFFVNHGLLEVRNRPQWRTVTGGSREYVRRLTAGLVAQGKLRHGAPVVAVERGADAVTVRDADGHAERFDQVVLACHADQALALLGDADPEERSVLGAFRFQPNRAVLHSDPALMPRRRRAWASWNYLADGARGQDARVSVSYWMNSLQNLDPAAPLFVSLNPLREPDPALTHAAFDYDHPQFDSAAVAAQGRIADIQGRRGTWFCGAWLGYGFHEDGLSAGLAVAEAMGARRPWTVEDMSPAGANARPVAASKVLAAAE